MGCINKNLKDNQRLIQDFSETRVNQLFDEYFQDENPSYGEFISNPNVKEALGIIPISKVKSEIGKAFGKEISSRELKILKKSISNINDKLLGHSYKLFNIKQKGESDNYSWGLRKINSNINIQAKIDRLKQRINTGKQIRNLEDNQFNFPDVNSNLNQGLQWLKEVNPNVQPEIVQGLIDGIANGSYNSNLDLITLSEEFANKKTVKHEFLHKVLASLPFEQRESILNEASKKYGIARGESKTTTKYSQVQQNEINYALKAVDILQSTKGDEVFRKGDKNNWNIDKILQELQIPKDQQDLIKSFNTRNREEIITNLLAGYSFSVEINTATKENDKGIDDEIIEHNGKFMLQTSFDDSGPYHEIFNTKQEAVSYLKKLRRNPTNYYSNLTVPGGTNYTEQEISTPLITPSIKGHAQFATDQGIGWFRSDEKENKVVGWKEEDDFLNSETAQYNPITKDDKIIWGHPAIGKSYAAKKVKMIDFDSYKIGINRKYNLYVAPGLSDTELRTDDKTREARENWRYENEENQALWNQFIRDAWQQAKQDAKQQGAILFASDLLVLREFGNEVDKALTMPDELFFQRSKQRNNYIEGPSGTKVWKGNLNKAVANFKEKFGRDKVINTDKYLSELFEGNPKTRRILEVQSDLFQKGRDKEDLISKKSNFTINGYTYVAEDGEYLKALVNSNNYTDISKEEYFKSLESFEKIEPNKRFTTENQFLQLLNKNNNWVTFFVKSIIQDSAKKGYEKVLFPSGNTASKVEGHTTLEEFKKQKEDRIKELEKDTQKNKQALKDGYYLEDYKGLRPAEKEYLTDITRKQTEEIINRNNNEINQLKEELERVETEGFGALKPIYNFYENTVTNILNKTYGKENVKLITDEYGNTWNEIDLSSEKVKQQTDKILFQSPKLQYTGDLAIEEKIAEEAENSKDEIVAKTPLQKFIQSIRNLLRNIFREKDKISRLLRDMNQGRLNSNNRNTTNQDIKYQLSKEQSDAIDNVFDENPKLANEVYEALGFGKESNLPKSNETINIYAGSNQNAELSNFAIRPFTTNVETPSGEKQYTFQSVEQGFHFYKALVANNPQVAKQILATINGGQLKRLTNRSNLKMTPEQVKEWDDTSKSIMLNLMYDSYAQNPKAAEKLLATGNAKITHTQDNTRWKTDFPEVVMTVRDMLKEEGFSIQPQITPQQKQQAQQKFQEYVDATGRQDIEGFKEFVSNKTKGDYETKINKKALNESTDSDIFHYPFDEVYDELDQSEPTGEFEDTFDSEFETNSKKLDKIILNRYLKIQKSLERQKDKLVSEFNKIENTNDFTKDAEIYFDKHKELISEINIVEEKLKRIKAVVDAIFDKKDITSVVIAESNLIIDDINKLLKSENISPAELDYYYNLTKLLEEIHDENLKQEDSSLFTNASSEDLNQLKKLKNTFSNLNNDLLELLRKNINIKNDPIKDAKLFSQWFLKVGDYTNDILKKAESMISKSLFNITKFLNKELEAIKELHLKADSDFKRTGKQNNKFDIFFDKNKRIVQVFNYEYTDAAAKLYNAFRFASKDSAKSKRLELIRFHKQHSILLNAKYLFPDIYEHLTGTKVSAEEINKNIALYKSYLDDYTFEKMKSKVYKQTIKYLSKRDNDFFMSNMPFDENSLIQEFLTYIPKDKSNYNDKYSKIVQNDNLRNVYDKFMDLFNELKLISQGTTRSNLNKGFLPFLEKTMIENLSDFSFSTELGKFKQSILSSYDQLKNNSGQTVSNQVENPLKTVNDGLRSFLETKANDYYKQEKINLIYFLTHKKLTTNSAKLITEKFGPGFPSKKAEEIIESWTKEYFTNLEDSQTNDIQVLMNLMAQTVTSYKQKQAIESNLNLIKIAFDNQAVGEFDILGNLVGTNPTKKGRETKLAELLEVTINHFFGKNVQKPQLNDFLKRINNVSVAKQEELNKLVKEINENKELTPNEKIELEKALQNKFKKDSKYVDLDKINDKLLQYLRVLFLGWSPKSAFFNAAMGHIGNYMETIDGRIVDRKDLSAGVKMLFGKEKKKIQKLIANLSLIEDITKDFKKTTEESLHNEKWKNFKPERLQQIVEKSNQSPLIAALLNKSFNGVRIIDMIDESGNFLPQYEEYEYKFVNTAKYLIEKVHGPYDSNRIIMAETTSLGKNVIFMKKWMITSFFMKRFGSFDEKPREDLLMDYQFKGTYITLADVFNTMSNDQSGQRNYLLGIMKTMKAIALSDQSLTEVDKANLRSVRADLLIIGALLIAQQLVKYMLSDDDDDHEGLVFLLNTFFRIETELGSHYFLIDTFEGLAKNTIPQLDVYNRLEKIIKSFDENARISPAIRLAQMVPVLNSGVSLYNFFNQQILYNR